MIFPSIHLLNTNIRLLTIFRLVQYLSMLDYVTIRLNYYKELFQKLFSIYMQLNSMGHSNMCVMETSKFIIRSCLGWLFEHPNVPEEYYNYQSVKASLQESFEILPMPQNESEEVTLFSEPKELTVNSFNFLLEQILNAACPFLADFRVSVMPSKFTKSVSRSGRYRHITTKYTGDTVIATKNKAIDTKSKLVDAFLQSQSLSVRKSVEFVIERVLSAFIKDFQMEHLMDVRMSAKEQVDSLNANEDLDSLVKKVYKIYNESLKSLHTKWDSSVDSNIRKRAETAFDALLPKETLDDVKRTLIDLTLERIYAKLNDWRVANLSSIGKHFLILFWFLKASSNFDALR